MHYQTRPLLATSLIGLAATMAAAQPQPFFSIGDVAAPASPVGSTQTVPLPQTLFNFGTPFQPGELFTVKWIRFNLVTPISNELFIDIESRFFSLLNQQSGQSTLAIYDRFGALVATNSAFDPVLSFGSSGPRGAGSSGSGSGQNGATLPAGRYWLAVVAGGEDAATIAPTGWGASTSTPYPLGLLSDNSFFATLNITVGNTTPGAPPANDTCDGATTFTDALGASFPVWTGDAINATLNSTSDCYPDPSVQPLKDIWFRYVPTVDGIAELTAENGATSTGRPYLTRFGALCGGPAAQCISGDTLPPAQPTTLSFPVSAGQPVLVSLAVPADDNSQLSLRVSVTPTPTSTCLADIAGAGADNNEPDGSVDGTDFISFINSFAIGDATVDPAADLAGAGEDGLSADGTIDGSDFIAFINAFAVGC